MKHEVQSVNYNNVILYGRAAESVLSAVAETVLTLQVVKKEGNRCKVLRVVEISQASEEELRTVDPATVGPALELTIKWYKKQLRYGFLAGAPQDVDVFVPEVVVLRSGLKPEDLTDGLKIWVRYGLVRTSGKLQAVSLSLQKPAE